MCADVGHRAGCFDSIDGADWKMLGRNFIGQKQVLDSIGLPQLSIGIEDVEKDQANTLLGSVWDWRMCADQRSLKVDSLDESSIAGHIGDQTFRLYPNFDAVDDQRSAHPYRPGEGYNPSLMHAECFCKKISICRNHSPG